MKKPRLLIEEWRPAAAIGIESMRGRSEASPILRCGIRKASALHSAARGLKRADGTEAAWWLGLMGGSRRIRAVRALRILVEAVK